MLLKCGVWAQGQSVSSMLRFVHVQHRAESYHQNMILVLGLMLGLMLLHLVLCPQTIAPSSALKNYELLHRITGEGLSVEYCFSRQPFSPDANMVAVQMQFTNSATSEAKNLHMEDVKLQSGMRVKEFPEIGEWQGQCGCLVPKQVLLTVGINNMLMMCSSWQ